MVKPILPKIDERTASDIAQQVQALLQVYLKDYPSGLSTSDEGISKALIGVFARFAEIIIQRLNRVPNKNLLAFLNLLGASRLPPQPARVPLTFSLTSGSVVDSLVPVGTQVAAPPTQKEQDPVIFETEHELNVTSAQLASVFMRDSQQDTWGDRTAWLTPNDATSGFVFRGDRLNEHILYLACDELFTLDIPKTVTLTIQSEGNKFASLPLSWYYWDGQHWKELTVPKLSLTAPNSWQISTENFPLSVKQKIDGVEVFWIKVKLDQPLPLVLRPLPSIQSINASVNVVRENLLPDLAFTNTVPLDLTKDFYPFGENPHLSDTLYIASQEVFSKAGARVTVNFSLNGNASVNNGDIQLIWEAWDGNIWQPLTIAAGSSNLADKFLRSGSVIFTLPKMMAREQNGKANYWIRIRITGGNYGLANVSGQLITFTTLSKDSPKTTDTKGILAVSSVRGFMPEDSIQIASGSNTQETKTIESINIKESTITLKTPLDNAQPRNTGVWLDTKSALFPPLVNSLKMSYTYNVTDKPLSACKKYNDFTSEDCLNLNVPFSPFQAPKDLKPTLYFGLTLPPKRSNFPDRPLSLFVRLEDFKYGKKFVPLDPPHSRQFGKEGETVIHKLLVTNDTPQDVIWTAKLIIEGNHWTANVPTSIPVAANKTANLDVEITIPTSLNQRQSDRIFLQLTNADNPDDPFVYSAILDTFVGQEPPSAKQVYLSWEYWNGQDWIKFSVEDGTENFTRSGLIRFLVPNDFQTKVEFEQSERYWLRVRVEGDYEIEPRIQWVALNTIWANQSVTITNEILGASNGGKNQTFRTTRFPILDNQQLEVREQEKPSVQEQEQLEGEAIAEIANATEVWVRWQEVKDFYASEARDRHYILNHLTGEITFGDGINGLIPPVLQGNIRIARYQTGGGVIGNRQTQTISQLKTTVPYIDRVTNYEASTGGAEAESFDDLKERLPRSIRHSDRAVTIEDYEDLAMLATPEVARVKCFPLLNLVDDPLSVVDNPADPKFKKVLGDVSIMIVPRSTDIKPLPSMELINHVQDYLEAHAIATANIAVVGPLYVKVTVEVEIGLTSLDGASAVEQAVQQTLTSFLHPLTGGLDGNGWDFGREPYKSDFYALLEAIDGVDHVRTLVVTDSEDAIGAKKTGRFLVYSDKHKVSLFFEKS